MLALLGGAVALDPHGKNMEHLPSDTTPAQPKPLSMASKRGSLRLIAEPSRRMTTVVEIDSSTTPKRESTRKHPHPPTWGDTPRPLTSSLILSSSAVGASLVLALLSPLHSLPRQTGEEPLALFHHFGLRFDFTFSHIFRRSGTRRLQRGCTPIWNGGH